MPPLAFRRSLVLFVTAATVGVAAGARAGAVEDAVAELQHEWEVTRYQTPTRSRAKRYELLAVKAHSLAEAHADRSEPLLWEGKVLSSLASEKGGLSGLGLSKQARRLYEHAIALDPQPPDAAAYVSLAMLYFKAPGWPLGFGDSRRAEQLLQAALRIEPEGIDANSGYGEFLLGEGRPAEAVLYLERAMHAPGRPGRHIADTGRREEARELLDKARARLPRPPATAQHP